MTRGVLRVAVVFSGLFIAHFIGEKKWGNLTAAFLVAGLGAASADLFLGYGIFAPMTLIAKVLKHHLHTFRIIKKV